MPDQDVLNLIFENKVNYLPENWNILTRIERLNGSCLRSGIYHFAGDKWIQYEKIAEFDRLYLELREEVSWEKSVVNNELIHLLRLNEYKILQLQNLASQLTGSRKKLIFFGKNTLAMKMLCKIALRDGDYFIDKDPIDVDSTRYGLPIKDASSIVTEERGSFIVIVIPEANNGTALKNLEDLGLQNGIDYFVAPSLTTASQGGYEA